MGEWGERVVAQGLANLAILSPVLLAYIAGFVLSLVFWRRSPRACLLALLGTTEMFLTAVVLTFVWPYVSLLGSRSGWSGEEFSRAFAVLGVIQSCLYAGGLVLLLLAVFAGRSRPDGHYPGRGADAGCPPTVWVP
jgi:uncharacterized membrane protein